MKKKIKEYKPNKWLYILFFGLPLVFLVLFTDQLDNDLWYLLSEGRYIVNHGIYYIDPLSIHDGLQVIVQNWFSASFFWVIYEVLGKMGILTLMIICNFFICLLLYKISKLISENNYLLSLITMFVTDITLLAHFIVSRPQILSFITLLSVIYILELYIHTNKKKYLIWLPIISFIQINMHASLWWMIFLFTLPYIIDSFKCSALKLQGYPKKPLFIAIIAALLVGFINPYGYKAITFIFTSYGDTYMHIYINELLSFNFYNALSKHMFFLILCMGILLAFFREGKIHIRYLCLICGTMLLGFMSVKGFSHFILVSIFPFAYFFKDIFPRDFSELPKGFEKGLNIVLGIVSVFIIGLFIYGYGAKFNQDFFSHPAEEAITTLGYAIDKEDAVVYSSFNDGGYVEFREFKSYIDPRAELYLKKNNKKADIFKENYDLQHGLLDVSEFLKKYNFTHLLVNKDDLIYDLLAEQGKDYMVIYESPETHYRLYARKDLYSEEEQKEIIENYNKALQEAKDKEKKEKENN